MFRLGHPGVITKVCHIIIDIWLVYLFKVFNATFNNIFSYIVAVSLIGEGNQSTQRKPPTCRKSLTNFIT